MMGLESQKIVRTPFHQHTFESKGYEECTTYLDDGSRLGLLEGSRDGLLEGSRDGLE